MSVRYGLIGCGMMGREHLANIALTGGAHARAIFEPDAEMAAAAAGPRLLGHRELLHLYGFSKGCSTEDQTASLRHVLRTGW